MTGRCIRIVLTVLALAMGALAAFSYVAQVGPFNRWERESPLLHPFAVASVRDGAFVLENGRTLRPAGVRRRDSVPEAEYQQVLQIVGAQGVEITRDLGDGRAFMLAEPKFYNWCGTSARRWAGSYYQCPVSELLVESGYAEPDVTEPGLTTRERWRVEGAKNVSLLGDSGGTRGFSEHSKALRYMANEGLFRDYDGFVELMWKGPPGE